MKFVLEIPDSLVDAINEEIFLNSHNECDLGPLPSEGAWAAFQGIWSDALEKAEAGSAAAIDHSKTTSATEPNSQDCAAGGYKLSSIVTEIRTSQNVAQVFVGCQDDDSFYEGDGRAGRVQVGIELDDGTMAEVDLEDVLKFARIYCNGIFWRVLKDFDHRSTLAPS